MTTSGAIRWTFLGLTLAVCLLCGLASASQAVKEYRDSDKELNVTYQKILAIGVCCRLDVSQG